ncbi:MAG: FAD-dependent oxidoreductase, partial [Chloroflexi bacterium]|nr:FAD-dependent oxidoreductase [Chloroflexota bacterium]
VAVIGAGNTAFDAAQTALRLSATDVTIVYRRSAEEAPARSDELEHARQEGIAFQWLTAPARFIGDARGRVRQMTCIRMKLGEPEADGRRKPVPDPGSEFTVDVDTVVLALGFSADPTALTGVTGLETKRDGLLTVDPETLRTSRQGVWAAGDVVTGPSTVVSAMAQAKKAAKDIHDYLEQRYTAK